MSADFRVDLHLVIMTIEPLTSAAQTWVKNNTEPWQWQDDRLCIEYPLAFEILQHIALDGLRYEEALIEIPDEKGTAERLLRERNWVQILHRRLPENVPKYDDAVALIEQALRQNGFLIQ